MASPKRNADAHLIAMLGREGKRFGFFQAVDLIERLTPSASPVGYAGPASAESIRFQHNPELTFHASDVKSIVPRDPAIGRNYTTICSSFLGLFGTVSPLPITMCEDVLADEAADQPSLREFYDIFHHRILSLFFRAWQKQRFYAGHRIDMGDPFTRRALAFVGVDVAGAIPDEGVEPLALLGLSPVFAQRARSARALEIAAERLLGGIRVKVESFVLRRTAILPEQRVTLGVRNTTLGVDMAVGRSVADRSGRFRVAMGPLSNDELQAVSPGGRLYPTLRALLEHFSGGVLEAEVSIEIAADQAPRFRLGKDHAARLGQTTRLAGAIGRPLISRFVPSADPALSKPHLVEMTAP